MKYIVLAALFLSIACKKEESKTKDFGCVYGENIATGAREYIFCIHREMNIAGYNQVAADKIAETYNLPKVNVTIRQFYKNTQFVPNPNCDCD